VELLESAWRAVGGESSVLTSKTGEPMIMWESSLDALCEWYIANLFGGVARACQSMSEAMVMEISEENNVAPPTVDKLKNAFDLFDDDGSGVIEQREFHRMLAVLLNVGESNRNDLSRDRVYRFWKEIDKDGSGEVDFREFCGWYLKYFSPEQEATSTSIDGEGLLGKFYSTYEIGRRTSTVVQLPEVVPTSPTSPEAEF
jgi:hypothetical protein